MSRCLLSSLRFFWLGSVFLIFVPQVSAEERPPYDWTSFYIGGSIGMAKTSQQGQVSFKESRTSGWENGIYLGPLAQEAQDDFHIFEDEELSVFFPFGNSDLSSPHLTSGLTPSGIFAHNAQNAEWLRKFSSSDLSLAFSVRIGADYQLEHFYKDIPFVFGFFSDYTPLDQGQTVTHTFDGKGGYTGTNTAKIGDIIDNQYVAYHPFDTTFSSVYTQTGKFSVSSKLQNLFTMQMKMGVPFDRFLVYASGGLAIADTSLATSASVIETLSRKYVSDSSDPNDIFTDVITNGPQTTTWQGAKRHVNSFGYALGGGVSYAVTDHLIWTTDGYYFNLGHQSITATSATTNATYTISNTFDGFILRTGVEWRF